MKRLFLVFGLVFFTGCESGYHYNNYTPSPTAQSADPRAQLLQIKADELRNMGLALESESKQLIADANSFYETTLPAFLRTLDDNQLKLFNDYHNLVFGESEPGPVEVEMLMRSHRQAFTVEQQLQIARLTKQEGELVERKRALISQIATYNEKQKELWDYGSSILQANQQEAELRRQRTWQQYQLQQQQNNNVLNQATQPPPIQVYQFGSQQDNSNYWQEQRAKQQWWDTQYRKMGVTPH